MLTLGINQRIDLNYDILTKYECDVIDTGGGFAIFQVFDKHRECNTQTFVGNQIFQFNIKLMSSTDYELNKRWLENFLFQLQHNNEFLAKRAEFYDQLGFETGRYIQYGDNLYISETRGHFRMALNLFNIDNPRILNDEWKQHIDLIMELDFKFGTWTGIDREGVRKFDDTGNKISLDYAQHTIGRLSGAGF